MAKLNWRRTSNRQPYIPKDNRRDAHERGRVEKVLKQREVLEALRTKRGAV